MKLKTAALLTVALTGCADTDKEARTGPADACSVVAEQRMRDGALNGYDRRLQKFTYDYAYADCVKWNRAHGISF